jgi:uncharacterized membrane protein YraQ (UPF0718 family)
VGELYDHFRIWLEGTYTLRILDNFFDLLLKIGPYLLISIGIPFSAVIAFVVSSPLMNPSVFILTAAELGMEMAVARTVTALIFGLAGGLLVMPLFRTMSRTSARISEQPQRPGHTLRLDIWKTFRYTAKYFSIAILLSAAVKVLVPPQAVADFLGSHAATGTLQPILFNLEV